MDDLHRYIKERCARDLGFRVLRVLSAPRYWLTKTLLKVKLFLSKEASP